MWYHREAFVVNCQEKKVISRKRITSCSKLCGYLTDVRYKGLRQGGLGRCLLWLWISAVFNFRLRFISISYSVLCACLPSQVPVGQPVFLNTTSANTLWGHAGSSGHHCTAQPAGEAACVLAPTSHLCLCLRPSPISIVFHIFTLSVAPNCPHAVPSTWNALPCLAHLEISMETRVASLMGSLA